MDFSSGSSDEAQFSEHSSDYSSDSDLGTNCGYLEVSWETLKQKSELSKTELSLINKETATSSTINNNIQIQQKYDYYQFTDDGNNSPLPLEKKFPEAEEQVQNLNSPSVSTSICSPSEESGSELDFLSGLRKVPI